MDPINPLDGINELIRRRATESSAKLESKLTNKPAVTQKNAAQNNNNTIHNVKQKVIEAINSIDVDDKRKNQKVAHVFVESILLWQFGDELINDPGFTQLVDDVGQALLNDSSVMKQLTHLLSTSN